MKLSDEIVDFFDAKGNKIGKGWLWKEAHQKGIWHETAASFIFKNASKEELLLQKRSQFVTHETGKWSHSGGGHLPSGMGPLEGIKKELHEELFKNQDFPDINIKEILCFPLHDIPNNYEFLHLFELIYPGPFFLDPVEVKTIEWVSFTTIQKEVKETPEKYAECFKLILKEYLKKEKK